MLTLKGLLCIDSLLGQNPSDYTNFVNKEVAAVLHDSQENFDKIASLWTKNYAMYK
jgi:hypothetical protein